MEVLRDADSGCRGPRSQHPGPSLTGKDKERVQEWTAALLSSSECLGPYEFYPRTPLPGLRHSSSPEKWTLLALLQPTSLHFLP